MGTMTASTHSLAYAAAISLLVFTGCDDEDTPPHTNNGLAASAGSSGAAGHSGSSGASAATAGSSGTAGTSTAGTSGASGSAGVGGTGTTGGSAGTSGASAGTGGTGGTAGSGGSSGSAGLGGSSGAGGIGATAGASGAGGTGGSGGSAGSIIPIGSISAAEITILPTLANATGCFAKGITSDGTKVIGTCTVQGPNGGQSLGVVWDNGTPTALPVLDAQAGCAGIGTNFDASIILGFCGETGFADNRPVRWISGGPPQAIDPFDITDGGNVMFETINQDGTVLGGWVGSSVKYQRPALWSGGYNVLIEPGVLTEFAAVSSISADGKVATGVAPHNGASQVPFRYDETTGITFLTASSNWWSAKISGDGKTIYVEDFNTGSGAVWTEQEGVVPIVGLGEPHAVDQDGRLMVGSSTPYPMAWFDRQLLDLPALVLAGSGPVEPAQQGTLNAITPDGFVAAGDAPSLDGIQRAFVLRFIP